VCDSAGEAVETLEGLRRAVFATGAGLIGSGTHPAAGEGEAQITDKERYERIRDLLGDAVATPVAGLHIHIGMPDEETAIRAFNGLRRHLPLLQALGANSPYRHGRDTGLASAREVTIRGWPRSGVPRAMRDYGDFCEMARLLARAADVPDYTWFWWKLRPHSRLGTVEIRALDTQRSVAETGALVALAHCLARHASEAGPRAGPSHGGARGGGLSGGPLRGARAAARCRGGLRHVGELLQEALALARVHALELGCAEQLDGLATLVADGGRAGRQRAAYEIAGMDGLLRALIGASSGASELTSH
jgi:carboxylate-amine ligase